MFAVSTFLLVTLHCPNILDPHAKTSPFELFARSEVTPNLNHFQPFGCPVFVLDNKMQSGKKLPKWEVRSRMGVYLGMSMQHARSVALVLNLKTGHVSPQFHVVFDDDFTTVPHLRKGTVPPNWEKLVSGSREKSTEEFFDLTKTWFEPISDASADEIMQSTTTDSEGDSTGPIMNSNEGDSDQPFITPVSEGDT